ncbi:nucleotidyltransferase domain-containing protein [Porticoccaceae bacterium LTM1]|nr:nucleotidyltransferase domain-containing protein [Porticoccaceae bacterium LTM1]
MTTQTDPVILQIIELAKKDNSIELLWLYGSRATGKSTESSDYDLAVAYREFEKDPYQATIRPHLLAMDWRNELGLGESQLSVVDINRCPIPLAYNIVDQGQLLLSKDDLRQAREQSRIWGLWADQEEWVKVMERDSR